MNRDMQYTYRYPGSIQGLLGRRYGQLNLPEESLSQTHEALMDRLDHPTKTLCVTLETDAPPTEVWEAAARTLEVFYSHQPGYAGTVGLNSLGMQEGGRFVVYRTRDGRVEARTGEVLVNLTGSHLVLSDLDIGDPSVSGSFPSLFSLRLDEGTAPGRTMIYLCHTALGVLDAALLPFLIRQLQSIGQRVEEKQ
jgi:hypothetical protein